MNARTNEKSGECPGCGQDRHPGWTCDGKDAEEVTYVLIELGAVYVPLRAQINVDSLEKKKGQLQWD